MDLLRRFRFAAVMAFSALFLSAGSAMAVPAFAVQTNKACQACHVGGFGPQLTPYGREFKIKGYTERASDAFTVPLSAMVVASFVHTQKDQAEPPAAHFSTNDNAAVDQVSIFLAGGAGHFGGFVQTTYDGVGRAWSWDNLDLRATTVTHMNDKEVVLGLSLNNSPTVQDPWNTLPAWGFPFTSSSLAPSPSASPLFVGGLAQETLGLTAYTWIDSTYYIEVGGYRTLSASALHHLGADPFDPGDIKGIAPYGRLAYQTKLGDGKIEAGLFGMRTDLHPGRDRDSGAIDRYTDVGVDASYQLARDNGDVIAVDARYLHEKQALNATCILAETPGGDCANERLQDLRLNASYYWRDKIGATVGLFDTWGPANPDLFPDNRTFKPDSSGVILQLDATPWGEGKSPLGPRFNMRVGVQYTIYDKFNGARKNFDGAGANASDNNTLRIFTWFAY